MRSAEVRSRLDRHRARGSLRQQKWAVGQQSEADGEDGRKQSGGRGRGIAEKPSSSQDALETVFEIGHADVSAPPNIAGARGRGRAAARQPSPNRT